MDLAPFIKKLKDVDLTRKEPAPPTGPGIKGDFYIAKKRYDIQLKEHLDRIDNL